MSNTTNNSNQVEQLRIALAIGASTNNNEQSVSEVLQGIAGAVEINTEEAAEDLEVIQEAGDVTTAIATVNKNVDRILDNCVVEDTKTKNINQSILYLLYAIDNNMNASDAAEREELDICSSCPRGEVPSLRV